MFAELFSTDGRSRTSDAVLDAARPIKRRLIAVLLVPFLLILAQQAAFVHELGHFAQQVQRTSGLDRQTNGGDFCEKCFVFAHLSGASSSAPVSFFPSLPDSERPLARRTAEYSAESTFCRIRGPPFYL
jgi:hypothetical protein